MKLLVIQHWTTFNCLYTWKYISL